MVTLSHYYFLNKANDFGIKAMVALSQNSFLNKANDFGIKATVTLSSHYFLDKANDCGKKVMVTLCHQYFFNNDFGIKLWLLFFASGLRVTTGSWASETGVIVLISQFHQCTTVTIVCFII